MKATAANFQTPHAGHEEAPKLLLIAGYCVHCNAPYQGPYGSWVLPGGVVGGTCSKACEIIQAKKQRYTPPEERNEQLHLVPAT